MDKGHIKYVEEKIEYLKNYLDFNNSFHKDYYYFIYDSLVLRNSNWLSICDYLLDLSRQALTLSVSGFIGLLVAPENIFSNVILVRAMLLKIILISIAFIIIILIIKLIFISHNNFIISSKIETEKLLFNERKKRKESERDDALAELNKIYNDVINKSKQE